MTADVEDTLTPPQWQALTVAQRERWTSVLDTVAAAIPDTAARVLVDGEHAATVAERLADTLRFAGRSSIRLSDRTPPADDGTRHIDLTPATVTLADGPRWRTRPPGGRWDLVIWLRTRRQREADTDHDARREAGLADADIAIDLRDPRWPIIRHIADRIAPPLRWQLRESQAFFAPRAATWDTKFGDDLPAYAAAVAQTRIAPGITALDLGCGTGRALPALRHAVGPAGQVIGIDLTPQMLHTARAKGRDRDAALVLADAHRLPLADMSIDTVFAAGLLTHLTDLHDGLTELARITRPAGQLVVFHPTGRAALAARHGRTLRPDEPLAEHRLTEHLAASGWRLDYYDDPPHRFLALATRR